MEPHIFDVWVPLKRSAIPFAVSLPANSVCNLRLPQLTLRKLRYYASLQVLSLRPQTRASVSSHSHFVCKSAIVLALNLTSCKQNECVAPSLCSGTKQRSCDGTTKRRANRYAFCFFKRRNHPTTPFRLLRAQNCLLNFTNKSIVIACISHNFALDGACARLQRDGLSVNLFSLLRMHRSCDNASIVLSHKNIRYLCAFWRRYV